MFAQIRFLFEERTGEGISFNKLMLEKTLFIIPIVGNHEYMAMQCLPFLSQEITEESLNQIDTEKNLKIMNCQRNGSMSTLNGFKRLDEESRKVVLDYLCSFDLYRRVSAGNKNYILVHGGLRNFSLERDLADYDIDELVWERPDYDAPYFDNVFTVTGHTPTLCIEGNERPGYLCDTGQDRRQAFGRMQQTYPSGCEAGHIPGGCYRGNGT